MCRRRGVLCGPCPERSTRRASESAEGERRRQRASALHPRARTDVAPVGIMIIIKMILIIRIIIVIINCVNSEI